METSVKWLSAEQRHFIYSLGRDLVWLLPGHASGPLGSAIITIMESFDPVDQWEEDLQSQLNRLGNRVEEFFEHYDSKKNLLAIKAYLSEIRNYRRTLSTQIFRYGELDATDLKTRQETQSTVLALLDEIVPHIKRIVEDELKHVIETILADKESLPEARLHQEPYASPIAYARAMLTFDTLILGIHAVMYGYKTLIECWAWKNSFGEDIAPGKRRATFQMMQDFCNIYLPQNETPSILQYISQNIFARRSISISELKRDEHLPYAIQTRYHYTSTDNPFFPERLNTPHESVGFLSSGDNFAWESYWACFEIFPLTGELLDKYGTYRSDICTNSSQLGLFVASNVQIDCRVRDFRIEEGVPRTEYDPQDLLLYAYLYNKPPEWKGYFFEDFANGQRFFTLDDCWSSCFFRYARVSYWSAYPDKAQEHRRQYLSNIQHVAEREFIEGRPEVLQEKFQAWKELCQTLAEEQLHIPPQAPVLRWTESNPEWDQEGLELRYGIRYVHQQATESPCTYTPWCKTRSQIPELDEIVAPPLDKGFISIKIYREFRLQGRHFTKTTPIVILLPHKQPSGDYRFKTSWTDLTPPLID